jgi:hypothetical protein
MIDAFEDLDALYLQAAIVLGEFERRWPVDIRRECPVVQQAAIERATIAASPALAGAPPPKPDALDRAIQRIVAQHRETAARLVDRLDHVATGWGA